MNCLRVPNILMPNEDVDLSKWSVIACDQYTSQPEYWEETEKIVGKAPSSLKLTLPEVYLEREDVKSRIENIHKTMETYVEDGILQELPRGFVLIQRKIGDHVYRYGLLVAIDLETYEYKKGEHSLIRPTEMTVEERIPPRLKVRKKATLELPHIMLLIDDEDQSIIEPLIKRKEELKQLYDVELMQNGGHISGWFIEEGDLTKMLMKQIEHLGDRKVFEEKYHLKENYPVLNLAVGDGNHSMATAKAAWEEIKKDLSEEEKEEHPARFCLCEIVNIHDASLEIEPIHRVLFEIEVEDFINEAKQYYQKNGCEVMIDQELTNPYASEEEHVFGICTNEGSFMMKIRHPKWGIAVATLQGFLDAYLSVHSTSKIDYIHGKEVVERLGTKVHNIGILLPDVKKEDIFKGVILDGVLPRKTFSMGEANEKRYYMESKRIVR